MSFSRAKASGVTSSFRTRVQPANSKGGNWWQSPLCNDIPFDTIFLSIMQNMSLTLLSNGCYVDIFQRFWRPKVRNLARYHDRSPNLRICLFDLLLFSLHAYVMLSFDVICVPVCLRACRRSSKG